MTATQIEHLAEELQLFEQLKPQLMAQGNSGKYALIGMNELVGIWETYVDALQAGYQKFGLNQRFLVKKIDGLGGVKYFTRDIKCPASPAR